MATGDGDLSSEIETNAEGPKSASGDSGSFQQHSLTDQIAADKYLRAKAASAAGKPGIKLFRLIPPGTAGP